MEGKPCRNITPTNEQWSESQGNVKIIRELEIGIEEAIEKAMEPFEKRIQAMENAKPRKPINRMLNGSEIPFNHTRGTNQERIHYSD